MPRRPLFLPLSRHHQMPPPPPSPSPLGPFDSPPPVPPPSMPPPGFIPFSHAPLYYFTPRRPSRAVISLQHLPLEYYRRYVDRTVGNLWPVAGRRGRARRTPAASQPPNPRSPGRRHTSRNPAAQSPNLRSPRRRPTSRTPASQPPNPRSPGRSTNRTPDVQEVRQACQSQRQDERWVRDTSFVDDDSSTAEGVSSRELHKCVSRGRTHHKMVAAADHEKGKHAQTSHRQSVRGKKKRKRQTDQISISDYADSTAGDEGYIEEAVHEGSFVADSQYEGIGEGGHLCHPSQGQDRPRGPCNEILEMTNAPTTGEGDFMQVESQELMPSMRNELGAPFLADSQEARQAQASYQSQPSPRKAKRQKEQTDSMEDASNTSEGGEMREMKLQKLTSSEKNELEKATVPRNSPKDAAYDVLGEVDNTLSPLALAQMTSSFHDQADSCSLTLSSVLNWATTFDDVSSHWGSEVTTVKVGNYIVDQKHSTTMNAIIKKYGDIAKDCRYASTMFRSYAVRGVCEVVEGLNIPLQQLSRDRLVKYSDFVKEAAEMGLSVEWLEERLGDVSKAIESLKEYKNIRDTRKGNMGKIGVLKKEIGLLVTKKMKCESEVEGLKWFYKAAKLEVRKKKSAVNDIKSRCKAIPKLMLDGLY